MKSIDIQISGMSTTCFEAAQLGLCNYVIFNEITKEMKLVHNNSLGKIIEHNFVGKIKIFTISKNVKYFFNQIKRKYLMQEIHLQNNIYCTKLFK